MMTNASSTHDAPKVPSRVERAENTDNFTQSTKRCTRRAWDVFLALRDDLDAFNDRVVRARLELKTEAAAKEVAGILANKAGVTRSTRLDNVLEFTATLAGVQHVIKHPDCVMLDCVLVD